MSNDYFDAAVLSISNGTRGDAPDINNVSQAVETAFGLLPTPAKIEEGRVNFYTQTGAANVYTVTTGLSLASYTTGLQIWFKVVNANTTSSTLNVDGLGAVALTYSDGTALASGALVVGDIVGAIYDGSKFQLQKYFPSSAANAAAAAASAAAAAASAAQLPTIAAGDQGKTLRGNNAYTAAEYKGDSILVAGGTANALTVTASITSYTYLQNKSMKVRATANNTGAATINFDSLGVKDIKTPTGAALIANYMCIGRVYDMIYDGTNVLLLNPSTDESMYLDWQTGLVVDVTGTTYGYSVTAGSVMDSTGVYRINLISSLTKAGGTTWAAGTSQGGKSNNDGAIAGDTVYKLYVVSKSSNPSDSDLVNATSLAAALADTNVAAAGYNIGRCIFGYLRTNVTPNKFEKVTCLGNNLYKFTGLSGGGDFAYDFDTMTNNDVEGVIDIFAPPNHNAEVSCFMDNLAATTITIFAGEEIKGYFTPSTGGQFDSYISGSGVRIFRKLINSGASARAYVSLNKSGSGTVEVRINTQGFYHNLTALS